MTKNEVITFVGSRNGGVATVSCYQSGGKDKEVLLEKYYEHVNHSPDEFEWGYGGSGPCQLGFAIILKTLEVFFIQLAQDTKVRIAKSIYHNFVRAHIAKLNQTTSWALDSRIVENFIVHQAAYSKILAAERKEK